MGAPCRFRFRLAALKLLACAERARMKTEMPDLQDGPLDNFAQERNEERLKSQAYQ